MLLTQSLIQYASKVPASLRLKDKPSSMKA
jgi:hypothetical protein